MELINKMKEVIESQYKIDALKHNTGESEGISYNLLFNYKNKEYNVKGFLYWSRSACYTLTEGNKELDSGFYIFSFN